MLKVRRNLFFYFCSLLATANLSSRGLRRSGVVGLQEALQIQNLQLIRLLQRQQLAQGGIRLDVLLLHQTLVLGVLAHAGRHIRAGQLGALGHAQEGAQRIRDGHGLLEDGLLLGGTIRTLSAASAAALLGALQLTGNLLLQLLQVGEHGTQSSAQRRHLLDGGVELGDDVHILLGVHLRGHRGRRRGRRGHGGGRRGGDHRCRSSGRGGSLGGLTTGGGLGGSGGRAHLLLCLVLRNFYRQINAGNDFEYISHAISQFWPPPG
jgi:hypothetical protein